MRYQNLFCSFFILLILTGCAAPFSKLDPAIEDSSYITIGNILEIKNLDNHMILLDHKETLAADGLYYISWGITNPEINSQETEKLETNIQQTESQEKNEKNHEEVLQPYLAQLYLLAGEAKNSEEAQRNMDAWLATSKENYQILTEKEISCNEQTYSVLLYSRSDAEHIYTRGISAFSTINHIAICIELISTKDFPEDLETTITNFLNHCSYLTE